MIRLFIFLFSLFLCTPCFSETVVHTLTPQGDYATIDTSKEMEALRIFREGSTQEVADLTMEIINHSSSYAPVVFYYLAAMLWHSEHKDGALFWLFVARIRTTFDIKRYSDTTVSGAYAILEQNIPQQLRLYPFENIQNTKALLDKAILWDEKASYDYDSRWINLHGMNALQSGLSGTSDTIEVFSEDKVNQIRLENQDYWVAYSEQLLQMTPQDIATIKQQIQSS